MGRLSFTTTVKVKRVITLKRTLQLSSRGFGIAAFIVGIFFFTQNVTQSDIVKAGITIKTDTLLNAPNIDRGDSLVNNNSSQNGIHSEDNSHLLTDKDLTVKKSKKKVANGGGRSMEFHDLISISPKLTTGVFEVNFEIPLNQSGATNLEIVNREGEVIETRTPQTQSGIINEVFTLDSSVPSGAYLVKIHVGKNLYVRQIIYTKP
ncbi:hypothetical protein LBMAG27_06500 [Bacteroidota bacterium]|nr:hypothetical protein LBMAG27_06500 [Bacteroidota bacterium]